MVYAEVPEHEGFNDGTAADKAPRPVSTDGWLERISDQLQVFVDAIHAAQAEDDADEQPAADGAGDPGADEKSGDTPPADTPPADTAKKTTAAKRAEVKGD